MNTEDKLLTVMSLSRSRNRWRLIGIFLILILIFFAVKDNQEKPVRGDYIAAIEMSGVIDHDPEQLDVLESLVNDDHAKAVYVLIDSPGGSMQPALDRYHVLRKLSAKKPVVVRMGKMAASAGYLVAIAADYIIAGESTLTGSVGVFLPLVDATILAEKIGVTSRTLHSGIDKLATFPFEKVSQNSEKYLQDLVDELHDLFIDYVQERRHLSDSAFALVKTGRAFTGKHALELGLVDGLSHQQNVVQWLHDNREIPPHLPIVWQENVESFSLLKELGLPFNLNGFVPHFGVQALFPHTVTTK